MLSADKIQQLLNAYPVVYAAGNVESLLLFLRQQGCSILDCIKVLHSQGVSLAEAKRRVHLSETWSDIRPQVDDLHDQLQELADI